MANICWTNVYIKGNVAKLTAALMDALHVDGVWDYRMTNLSRYLGIPEDCFGDAECADIFDFEGDDNEIALVISSDYVPELTEVKLMVEKYAPDACIYYTAIEPGGEIFLTNDPEFASKYYVYFYDTGEEDWYSPDDLKNMICRSIKTEEPEGLPVLKDIFCDYIGVIIHRMEFCDIKSL